jgi:hypothetical protein
MQSKLFPSGIKIQILLFAKDVLPPHGLRTTFTYAIVPPPARITIRVITVIRDGDEDWLLPIKKISKESRRTRIQKDTDRTQHQNLHVRNGWKMIKYEPPLDKMSTGLAHCKTAQ